MTIDRAKTIEMARQVGIETEHIVFRSSHASLERFAALVRAQVIEEAAQLCMGRASCHGLGGDHIFAMEAEHCAGAIRTLKSDSVHPAAADAGASTAPLPGVPGATASAEPVWCGCGDGIMPDTGAKCGTCVNIASLPNYPRTPRAIREFIGSHFSARQDAKPAGEGSSIYAGEATEDDVYTLSVHDLLSAFEWWSDTTQPSGWIPVGERLPEPKQSVLVAAEFDGPGDWRIKVGGYAPEYDGAFHGWHIHGASWKPTHWMPLPAAPKEA